MKKNKLLIVSIIIFILSFLNRYFGDQIIDKLFIFSLMIDIPLLIIKIFCMLKSVECYRKDKNKTYRISFYICLLSIIVTLFFPFREVKTRIELHLYEKDRLEVLELVKKKKLTSDKYGNATLPAKLRKTSTSGEILIYQNDEEVEVGFWVFRGLQSGSTKLIYSSNGEKLIKKNEIGYSIIKIKKLKENWYYVITDD